MPDFPGLYVFVLVGCGVITICCIMIWYRESVVRISTLFERILITAVQLIISGPCHIVFNHWLQLARAPVRKSTSPCMVCIINKNHLRLPFLTCMIGYYSSLRRKRDLPSRFSGIQMFYTIWLILDVALFWFWNIYLFQEERPMSSPLSVAINM